MPGRGRTRGAVTERVDALSSRRDALDAEQAERRVREDAALRRWAGLAVQREEIGSARDAEVERLDAERVRVCDDAARRLSGVEAEQGAVMLELNRDGRTVEQLSSLFALPRKQVQAMLRAGKATNAAPTESTALSRSGGAPGPDGAASAPRAAPFDQHGSGTVDGDGPRPPVPGAASATAAAAGTG